MSNISEEARAEQRDRLQFHGCQSRRTRSGDFWIPMKEKTPNVSDAMRTGINQVLASLDEEELAGVVNYLRGLMGADVFKDLFMPKKSTIQTMRVPKVRSGYPGSESLRRLLEPAETDQECAYIEWSKAHATDPKQPEAPARP